MPFDLRIKIWFPLAAFFLFGTVALLLWQDQNLHDRELVYRYAETSAEQVRIRIEGLMNARLASLELMAARWLERTPPDFSRIRFRGFASALYNNYPGYTAIFWIDSRHASQWVFPENRPVADLGKQRARNPQADEGAKAHSLKYETGIVLSPCGPSREGETDFHAVRALVHENQLQGYLGGVFSVEQVMALCLTKEVLNDFRITVSEGNVPIFQHGHPDASGQSPVRNAIAAPRARREILFGGHIWTLDLAINQTAYSGGWRKNLVFLAFGLGLAGALALLLHLLIQRMEMLKTSRDQALVEVDERKRVQQALKVNQGKMQVLLDELTAKNAELESFVYTVSHDLKTPIVTIEGFIGALREDFSEHISEVSEQYLGHMSKAAQKMERLISELLNYSRIGRLEGEKTVFSMSRPFTDALATLHSQVASLGIAVTLQVDLPAVYGDRKRIEQAVYNLLSNAVKYIGADNPGPRIDIGCTEQNQESVFWVRDNGIGIDPRYFDKIFQIFERLPPAKLAAEGTGIGLAIVKRIIEHHGGRIWLTSELGRGTTFYFTVKAKETA